MLELTTLLKAMPIILLVVIMFMISNRENKNKIKRTQAKIWLKTGDLSKLKGWISEVKKKNSPSSSAWQMADSMEQEALRMEQDFSLMEDVVMSQLKEKIRNYNQTDKISWERSGLLQYKVIDGEKRYIKNGLSNMNISLLIGNKALAALTKNNLKQDKGVAN
ncbi:hypothetical protein [Saccharicrinis sp. 156]|uniref:hypothetical protein n=1 Tax=Saccharicrinis sp. 156 TaxID=3417574 RepID=UPI003D3583D4